MVREWGSHSSLKKKNVGLITKFAQRLVSNYIMIFSVKCEI